MPDDQPGPAQDGRILVKLRPSQALRAAESRANLRPLYATPRAREEAFRIGAEPQWFLAELAEGGDTVWDVAHARVADQLGVASSDVVFAEPDLVHGIYPDPYQAGPGPAEGFAVGERCEAKPQSTEGGQQKGPHDHGWHLDDDFSQLRRARDAVSFSAPRTRIAHLDTGYYARHVLAPENVLRALEMNFVERDGNPSSAEDPDNKLLLLDNSGHGTGTLSVLAGGKVPLPGWEGAYLGGAPHADIVPLRVADSVVLLRTSAFARALDYARAQLCDVATMSMGGLPSRAWRETVDEAYLAGMCICSAAGNNFNGLPTRNLVYPARYGRVLAVCGVMAGDKAYAGLEGLKTMEGNYGPSSKMEVALAAYTPNIPWAVFGCPEVVRLNGGGTSSATPQVAAAAALWLEKYKAELPRDWRRVEAVRHALFSTAKKKDRKRLGQGVLQAFDALAVRPLLGLPQTKSDKDWLSLFRVLTGLGIEEAPPREQMFNLELAQRWLLNPELARLVEDPDAAEEVDRKTLVKVMEAVIEDERASLALRRHLAARYAVLAGKSPPRTPSSQVVVPPVLPVCDVQPALPDPPHRRLRVYAVDPSLSTRLDTAAIHDVTLAVRWETLEKGPVGEYLAVEGDDPSGRRYDPVDLDDPRLLAQDGWAPSEGNPQFHQQMVYAVAMKTIEHFEKALGRPVLWRPRPDPKKPEDDSGFLRRLSVRPHALRQANAFYSPTEVALQFGYFESGPGDPGSQVPGSRVYTCLSHDIVAHETTHAILDGMYRRYSEPSNPDVLALHEAFADIVALMQHFTMREVLEREIGRTRGDIESESMLGSLAVQFGEATGRGAGLRNAIGTVEDGAWTRHRPDPAELARRQTPHGRGAILVAAVFDAFIAIYKTRSADLLRIYTGGTGVLPEGEIHPDLVRRLAGEASKSAGHVLNMCIRALDYLPPVDVTFFEYLRALITADYDLVADDRYGYRVAFVEAFRRRGIYPTNLDRSTPDVPRTISVETLRWQGLDWSGLSKTAQATVARAYGRVVEGLKKYADLCTYLKDREALFHETRKQRRALHGQLVQAFEVAPKFAEELGVDPTLRFEVHELRRAMRVSPGGTVTPQIVAALTQSKVVEADPELGTPRYVFRGGSTLVVDLSIPAVKYRVVKNIGSEGRQERTGAFLRHAVSDPLRAFFFGPDNHEPFAALHSLSEEGM